jgi:hypothetical protein
MVKSNELVKVVTKPAPESLSGDEPGSGSEAGNRCPDVILAKA